MFPLNKKKMWSCTILSSVSVAGDDGPSYQVFYIHAPHIYQKTYSMVSWYHQHIISTNFNFLSFNIIYMFIISNWSISTNNFSSPFIYRPNKVCTYFLHEMNGIYMWTTFWIWLLPLITFLKSLNPSRETTFHLVEFD